MHMNLSDCYSLHFVYTPYLYGKYCEHVSYYLCVCVESDNNVAHICIHSIGENNKYFVVIAVAYTSY